ncbi:MAG: hypothetical protein SVV03_05615 [Candidatus Nanohaloarchaea archaeon]|nr:hypothetical protein [Candidatus Nanohaloarchaea archaeon]
MFNKIKEKMDAFAQKFAKFQTKLFLNLFYFLFAPVANLYLKVTGNIHHEKTGYFQKPANKSNSLDRHLKQY